MSVPDVLCRLPLRDTHAAAGAKLVPFAGYEMPLQYRLGILKEHLHTRAAAGLFDVSHMGQLVVRPRSGNMADAALALETILPADIVSLAPGRQRYSQLTTVDGGIFDDLMVTNLWTHFMVVVNASRKSEDEALIHAALDATCEIEVIADRALLSLQGPASEAIFAPLAPVTAAMRFMDAREVSVMGIDCVVTRSGYTGEDGFEISVPASAAADLWNQILSHPEAQPIGLGARDSLRLEAGLCLYGNDIDLTTSPVEAAIEWSIQKSRRRGGARAGGFPGDGVILNHLDVPPSRRLVGLRPQNRPVRAHVTLYSGEVSPIAIGHVTSGGFGPTVNGPISMGYVAREFAQAGTTVFAELRGERHAMTVTPLPFVPHRYKR